MGMKLFLHGMIAAVAATIALIFFKFWRQTRDRLLAFFSAAFGVMAIERVLHAMSPMSSEHGYLIYVVRLLGFVLILVGVLDKNRAGSR